MLIYSEAPPTISLNPVFPALLVNHGAMTFV
jgi:hypothetical protein